MFFVEYCGHSLHDPRTDDRLLTQAKMKLEAAGAGEFDFSLPATHPMRYSLDLMKRNAEVIVRDDDDEIFRGRIITSKEDFLRTGSLTCEGQLAYFNDSIVRPYTTGESGVPSTVDGYFAWLIAQHNAQVEPEKHFYVGLNEGYKLDKNNYILRSDSKRPTTGQVIKEKLLQSLGGYLRVRVEDGKRVIDYLADGGRVPDQEIEFGINLIDYERELDASSIITAVVPYGKTENDVALTIASLPDGDITSDIKKVGDYIYSVSRVQEHGWIFGSVEHSDITIASNLLNSAVADLESQSIIPDSVTIKAVDLSMISGDIEKLRQFDYVRVITSPHRLNEFMMCVEMEIDLIDPASNTYTFGRSFDTMTSQQAARIAELNATAIKAYEEATIASDRATEAFSAADEASEAASQAVEAASSKLSREDADEIYTTQTEHDASQDELRGDYSARIESAASALQTQISDNNNATNEKLNEIGRYIRFIDGKIVLGDTGNELTLTIQNDRVSFQQSGNEVAYFSDNKLYIKQAEVLTTLKIGNYEFVPRADGAFILRKRS